MRYGGRLQTVFIVAITTLAAAAGGCGRSDLTDYTFGDGGVDGDAGACTPTTCPTGCCDPSGTCQDGKELDTCGFGGTACNDCQAEGFDFCDMQLQACGTIQPVCNASTCMSGCCTLYEGQQTCVSGVSSLACGTGGASCTNCTTSGEACNPTSQMCVAAPCGPTNCMGCCAGATCAPTESDSQCGTGGLACTNCTLQSEFCNPSTGTCVATPPLCDSTNCTGCCAGDICVTSESNTLCGTDGAVCTDCTATSGVCTSGVCATACAMMSCPGCCLTGTCFAGFLDTRCGSDGAACVDCTATSSTCDISTTPRVCESTMTTCPATYTSCAGTVTTPVLSVTSGDCAASDLADAKAACTTGFASTSCQSFFSGEPLINAKCATCLAPFQYALTDGTGIFDCVSPYVSSTCNHDTGCISDCETQSCEQCSPSTEPTCITQVEMGQCSSYISGASCIGTALFGTAAFCSPTTYFGNYGDWLAAVGAHYCE